MAKNRREFLGLAAAAVAGSALASVNLSASENKAASQSISQSPAGSKNQASAQIQAEPKWDESYDVIVVGSGFAGLAAALKASERGLSVAVLEKMGRVGGNSVINGGGVAVVQNPVQAKTGITDSKELFISDCLKAGRGINHPELLGVIADEGLRAYEFLLGCGVEFKQTHCAHFGGYSVPRSMLTTNDSGSGFIAPMLKKLEQASGAKLMRRTKFDDFIVREGRVVGVRARSGYRFDPKLASDDAENKSGTPIVLQARRGVILASGGFGSDRAYRKLQDPRIADDADSTNHAGATAGAMLAAF